MAERPEALRRFLSALRSALDAHVKDPRAQHSLRRAFEALESVGPLHAATPCRLPVCRHLDQALSSGRFASPALRELARTFAGIEPSLAWRRRGGEAPRASPNFPEGHANATIVGPGGFERRPDVWLGVSLLAPDVRYPDHSHPPEETYLVMSEGEFRQGGGEWFEPGIGGSFYNPPGITHAMRSASSVLLAFWALRP